MTTSMNPWQPESGSRQGSSIKPATPLASLADELAVFRNSSAGREDSRWVAL
jgi:hypothetical protein